MYLKRKKCDICDGVGKFEIIDPVTDKKIKESICCICQGRGIMNVRSDFDDNETWKWKGRG